MSHNANLEFKLRNVTLSDIKDVYKILCANKPYVGLNSRYTYLLLARDFSDTCIVAENNNRIIGFSSGYIPPTKPDTFFNWETVVQEDYRGNGLQNKMLIHQITETNARYFECTINPSNFVAKKNLKKLANFFGAEYKFSLLFSEEDFENDGHEAELLLQIGPIDSSIKATNI